MLYCGQQVLFNLIQLFSFILPHIVATELLWLVGLAPSYSIVGLAFLVADLANLLCTS